MSSPFQGKHVLVTGADGFIGSHLTEQLVASGAVVRALVYYNSWNSDGFLSELPASIRANVETIVGDVRDVERVCEAVSGCDYVFHLSSLISIPYSYHAPRSYVQTNIIGALNVLEACRKADRLLRLIHTSTSEVYGSAQFIPITEEHPLVGQSPYAASKIAADKLAESYHLSFGLPVVIARPFNTFGPRQTARAVIPTIAGQLLSGVNKLKLGIITPTRDFNYVTDTVAALIALARCEDADGKVVNIGTGLEWSIENVARKLMEICGRKVPIICAEDRLRPKNSEVNRLLCDSSRLRELTDWRPAVEFQRGLEMTVEWMKTDSATGKVRVEI